MGEPIPILFTIPNFITAGSGQEMLNIIRRLDRSRFAPTVCVLRKGGALEVELERLQIPLLEEPFCISQRPLVSLPGRAWKAARGFREQGFMLWHSFHWSSDYTEPLIARLAGARAWVYTKKNMNWGRRAWDVRSTLATAIVARNQTMMERFFASPGYRRKATLIQGGVDTVQFAAKTLPRLRLREKFGLNDDELVVASVAQLIRVKGQSTILRAVAPINGLHVWLAGRPDDPAYAAELHDAAAALKLGGRVQFLGPVGDVAALLAEVDVFVLATSLEEGHEEGCPVALMEAMAAGKACVATDVAGSRDLIEHGTSGLLVKPDDPDQLGVVLRNLASSPEKRAALGREARRRIEAWFTLERESVEFQRFYEEVVASTAATWRF